MSIQAGREVKFTQVLEKLTKWRHELVEQMRNPSTTQRVREETLLLKSQLDHAIACLQRCERYQISLNAKVIEIPPPQNKRSSKYHLMDDCGSIERDGWTEVEINGKFLAVSPETLLIHREAGASCSSVNFQRRD
ncbi:hypothetical protein NDI39_24235 [Microcoleus sp. ZQ-A2]|nr:hypothetical protein [Microcoleus sp. FACHB-1]